MISLKYFFIVPPSTTFYSHLKNAARDYHKYWITVKDCPSSTQCHSMIRPWWSLFEWLSTCSFCDLSILMVQVSLYTMMESAVNVENFGRLSKDDVRRSAAKFNRDEKTQTRIIEASSSVVSHQSFMSEVPASVARPFESSSARPVLYLYCFKLS